MAGYYAAVQAGIRSGQAGRVIPSGPAGNIRYRFVPSGGGGGTRTAGGGGIGATALAALGRAKAQYEPGGGFGKGVEAGLERGRVKAVSAGMQNLVSAGLAGTTMAGGLGLRYEEEVAAPTRAGLEEERTRAISGIEMAEAGMGFQAGQAGLQRGFQAGESAAGRSLQEYIANLQARLQRESMAFRPRPTRTSQAQQFPSLYNQGGQIGQGETLGSLGGGAGGGTSIEMGEPMYGDPYVRTAEGKIIGTRQTNVSF